MSKLPDGWVSARIGNIVQLNPKQQHPNDKTVGFVPMAMLGTSYRSIICYEPKPWADVKKGYTQFMDGDVLLAKITPCFENGKAGLVSGLPNGVGAGSTEYFVSRPVLEAVDPRYLLAYFKTDAFLKNGETQMTGSVGHKRVPKDYLTESRIPLAPLNEQKRIADKLDAVLARVDTCRDRLDRIPAILKRFRQSVLAAAFTGKLTNEWRSKNSLTSVPKLLAEIDTPSRPNRFSSRTETIIDGNYALAVGNPARFVAEGWIWTPLVDIARMESGHTPSRSHPEYWHGDIPRIGIADARDGHAKTITDSYQHTNELGLANSAARLLPAGTVCLSRTASVGYVVRMGVPMATSQDFANWTCTKAIDPDWLKYLFVAENEAIYKFGKGSTHTTVYYPELMAFHVALPAIEEQHEIVRRVESLFAYADRLEARYLAARTQVEKLTPAILAKAFRGELVKQDPNDEPASELLARIAEARSADKPAKARLSSRSITTCSSQTDS